MISALLYGIRAGLEYRRQRRWIRLALAWHDRQYRPPGRGRWR